MDPYKHPQHPGSSSSMNAWSVEPRALNPSDTPSEHHHRDARAGQDTMMPTSGVGIAMPASRNTGLGVSGSRGGSGSGSGSGGGGGSGSGSDYGSSLHMGLVDVSSTQRSLPDPDQHAHIPLSAPRHAMGPAHRAANPATLPTTLLPPLSHAHRAAPAMARSSVDATIRNPMSVYSSLPSMGSGTALPSAANTGLVPGGHGNPLTLDHGAAGLGLSMTGPGPGPGPGSGSVPPPSAVNAEAGWPPSSATADRGSEQPAPPYPPVSKQIRRRMRMITSCLECRRRKLKCDKSQPCGNCDKFHRDCLYLGPKLDEASQLRLTQMKEKVGSLERQLERDVAHINSPAAQQQRILADDVEDEFTDDRELEPTDLVALDITYEDDADGGMDDLIDLGVAVGRVRITERISGISRPGLAEEISSGIDGKPGPPPIPTPPHMQAPAFDLSAGMSSTSWPDFLRPSASYIPPSSNFFMGQASGTPSFESLLPTRGAADRLIQQYFDCVHPVARCVHRPSFQAQYGEFWNHVYQNVEPRPSLQALVFAAMFSASVSMDEATAMREFGRTQKSLYEACKLGTEAALSKANFLRTTRFETMQAFVLYLLPLCRDEVSRAHSVLVGTAVRMAECMGLHRDGETYGLNPLDTHVRRLVWHQICFLDIRTCEAQGPKPAIRREDYDTKLPLNCDEGQLSRTCPAPMPVDRWTSTLLTLIRFEITEMMRIIWVDRRKLEAKQMTLTAVLTKIENFRKRMFEKYDRYLSDTIPIQRYAKLVMNLFLYRLHAMTLHAFHDTAAGDLPPRLNTVLITSGIMIIEIGIQLERNPLFHQWSWYSGAYHQFQIAMLLASEVYYNPQTRQAARIWGCLDYVFDTDRRLPPEIKGMRILGEIMYKTSMYQRMRKLRPPINTPLAPPNRKTSANKNSSMQENASAPSMPASKPQGPAYDVLSTSTQRGLPISHMVDPQPFAIPPRDSFAGVSDGQTLWSVLGPPLGMNSPNSQQGNEGKGPLPEQADATAASSSQQGLDIDWEVINNLFTNDPNTGDLSIPGFSDPALTIDWDQCT